MKLSLLLAAGVVLMMDGHLAHQHKRNAVVLGTAPPLESSMRSISERFRSPKLETCVSSSTSCATDTSTTVFMSTTSSNVTLIYTSTSTATSFSTSSIPSIVTSTYLGTDRTTITQTDVYSTSLTTTLSVTRTDSSVLSVTVTQPNMVAADSIIC